MSHVNHIESSANELSALDKFSLLIEFLGFKKEKISAAYENIRVINANDYFRQQDEAHNALLPNKSL